MHAPPDRDRQGGRRERNGDEEGGTCGLALALPPAARSSLSPAAASELVSPPGCICPRETGRIDCATARDCALKRRAIYI